MRIITEGRGPDEQHHLTFEADGILSVYEFFNMGSLRDLGYLHPPRPDDRQLVLGPGTKHVEGAWEMDLPGWDAETDRIPFVSRSVDVIWALHFLEHIQNFVPLMRECERVLKVNGTMNIAVPFWRTELAHQDPDHKRFFTESTFKTLFDRSYYTKGKEKPWNFDITFNAIMGVTERNLMVFTQLMKRDEERE